MIKSLRVYGVLSLFCLVGLSGIFAQDAKIAIVNIEGVIALSDMGKALQAKMDDYMKKVEAEIKPQLDMARGLQQQLQEGGATLTDAQSADLRRKLEDASVAIKRMQKDKQDEAGRIRNEGLENLEKALEPIFKQLRDQDGYDLILSSGSGAVLTASEKMDISKLVLERFNAAYAKK